MKGIDKEKQKIIVVFGILFVVVVVLLLLVFFAGKKYYTVKFELNGGTYVSGSLEQRVLHGKDATLPNIQKEGMYISGWSDSYRQVDKDKVISPIWAIPATVGLIYTSEPGQTYSTVSGCYEYTTGVVHVASSYDDKKVIAVDDGAFKSFSGITAVKLPNGIISIGKEAFADCTGITEFSVPKSVTHIGDAAFKGCSALEKIELRNGLVEIGSEAFRDCTSLKEIVIPASVKTINADTFLGCEGLVITLSYENSEIPSGFAEGWCGAAEVKWLDKSEKE